MGIQNKNMKQDKFCVVGMGDLVSDLMVPVNGFPIEADSAQLVDRIELQPGGMGNFLIAGQRIGLDMLPIDVVGADPNGDFLVNKLKGEGIDTSCIDKAPGVHTREIIVLADADGRHAFMAYRDAFCPVQKLKPRWQRALKRADALLTVGYSLSEKYIGSALIDAMKLVRRQGKTVFFDPGPLLDMVEGDAFRQAFQAADVVILTDDELELATGGRGESEARKLLDYGLRLICVKKGPQGCYLVSPKEAVQCPGYPVQVRDTNGAGDSFAAAFIYGYLHAWTLSEIGAFANVMGAVKVQKFGAGCNVPTLQEIQTMISTLNITLPLHF